MKKILLMTTLCLSFSAPAFASDAQDVISINTTVESPLKEVDGEVVVIPASAEQTISAISEVVTARNMGTAAIVFAVVQFLMVLIRGAIGDLIGRWKIMTLIGLTIVAGTIGYSIEGSNLFAAFSMSLLIIPPQITISQIQKQVFTKKGDT